MKVLIHLSMQWTWAWTWVAKKVTKFSTKNQIHCPHKSIECVCSWYEYVSLSLLNRKECINYLMFIMYLFVFWNMSNAILAKKNVVFVSISFSLALSLSVSLTQSNCERKKNWISFFVCINLLLKLSNVN